MYQCFYFQFYINEKWHTWIDYEKFHQLQDLHRTTNATFTTLDYVKETPSWAVYGAKEQGFNPNDERHYRKKKKKNNEENKTNGENKQDTYSDTKIEDNVNGGDNTIVTDDKSVTIDNIVNDCTNTDSEYSKNVTEENEASTGTDDKEKANCEAVEETEEKILEIIDNEEKNVLASERYGDTSSSQISNVAEDNKATKVNEISEEINETEPNADGLTERTNENNSSNIEFNKSLDMSNNDVDESLNDSKIADGEDTLNYSNISDAKIASVDYDESFAANDSITHDDGNIPI